MPQKDISGFPHAMHWNTNFIPINSNLCLLFSQIHLLPITMRVKLLCWCLLNVFLWVPSVPGLYSADCFFFISRALLLFYPHLFTLTFVASRFLSNLRVQHLTLLSVNKYLCALLSVFILIMALDGCWYILFGRKNLFFVAVCQSLS